MGEQIKGNQGEDYLINEHKESIGSRIRGLLVIFDIFYYLDYDKNIKQPK